MLGHRLSRFIATSSRPTVSNWKDCVIGSSSSPAASACSRSFATVRFLDDKRSGEENIFFRKEDEILIQNLLANHPEFDPRYSGGQLAEMGEIGRDVQTVCQKHGISNISLAFLKDIISVFESNGWKKTETK